MKSIYCQTPHFCLSCYLICLQALNDLQQFPSFFGHLVKLQYRFLSILDDFTLVREQSLLDLELFIEEPIRFPQFYLRWSYWIAKLRDISIQSYRKAEWLSH